MIPEVSGNLIAKLRDFRTKRNFNAKDWIDKKVKNSIIISFFC